MAALVSIEDRQANRQGGELCQFAHTNGLVKEEGRREDMRGLWIPRVGLNSSETYFQTLQNPKQNILKTGNRCLENEFSS